MTHPTMKKIHEGRNVKRFREMLGIKQEAMAFELGEDWTQKRISLLEQKESIDSPILEQFSRILKVPVEAFKNFDEEQAINLISCNFSDNAMFNNRVEVQNINPVEKWIEALEENKKLYERLLESEREKIRLMKGILEKMK